MEQKPSIGRIVLYNHPGSADGKFPRKQSPAIVQFVHEDGYTCDLYVFTAPTYSADGNVISGGGTYNNLRCLYGDGPSQWMWPPRV